MNRFTRMKRNGVKQPHNPFGNRPALEHEFTREAKNPFEEAGAIGRSHSEIFGMNLAGEEYLAELTWPRDLQIYDKMRRSDSQVQCMLLAMELPIRSTKWFVEPFSEDSKDKQVAQEVESNLFSGPPDGMTQNWEDFLRLALTMLSFGHSIFEKVYKIDEHGFVKWKKFAQRPQKTIYDFLYDEHGGPEGIQQFKVTGSSYDLVNIPIEKLIIFSHRMERGDLKGTSVLRHAYKHWTIKDYIYKIMNIGIERNQVGTPVMELPEGYDNTDYERAKDIVENLRSAEKGGAVVRPGFILKLLESNRNMMDVMPYIEHHDLMILRGILAQFINLGSGDVGSYALSKDQSDLFLMTLNSTSRYIASIMNSYCIPQLVNYNWDVEGYPKLNFQPIGQDFSQVGEVLSKLVQGRLLVPDENIEGWLREVMELPEKAETAEPIAPPEPEELPDDEEPPEIIEGKEGGCSCCVLELEDRIMGRVFQNGQRRWRRDLTSFEQRMNLEEIENRWDSEEEKLRDKGKEISDKQIQDLFERIRREVENGNYDQLAKIPVRYRGEFSEFMGRQYRDLVEFGKDQGAQELNIDKDDVPTPNELRRIADAQAGVVSDNVAQRIKTRMTLGVLNAIRGGATVKQALYRGREDARETRDRELRTVASAQVGEAVNKGRELSANRKGVELAQFSAILDDSVCPLCERQDGQIVEIANPDYDTFTPQLHHNCRCVWVYIDPEETPQPDPTWNTPPTSLVDQFGGLVFEE